jgi:hypothetical protein
MKKYISINRKWLDRLDKLDNKKDEDWLVNVGLRTRYENILSNYCTRISLL